MFRKDENICIYILSSNWQFPKSRNSELWIDEAVLGFTWCICVLNSSLSCLSHADCTESSCCSRICSFFSAIMYAMCASAEFWRTGGNDTAMCYKYIHRFWSQERVLQESNLTSYTMLFCTCLQHPIWMVTSHFDLSVCFLSCVNQQSSTLRNWPCFSWDSKVVIGWSVRVWGWIFKNCPPHQLLCSSPGPCCLSLSTGSL